MFPSGCKLPVKSPESSDDGLNLFFFSFYSYEHPIFCSLESQADFPSFHTETYAACRHMTGGGGPKYHRTKNI